MVRIVYLFVNDRDVDDVSCWAVWARAMDKQILTMSMSMVVWELFAAFYFKIN